MNAEKRGQYRQRLMDMRERVNDQAEHVTEGIREDISPPGNNSSAPLHVADFAMDSIEADAQVLAAERDILSRIDAALARLDDGTYGKCRGCGEAIGEERLRALPFADRCVDCAEADDGELSPDDVQED
jgi:RNA polymerase-binding protein DksA